MIKSCNFSIEGDGTCVTLTCRQVARPFSLTWMEKENEKEGRWERPFFGAPNGSSKSKTGQLTPSFFVRANQGDLAYLGTRQARYMYVIHIHR
jgi:hypothetical protein